MPPDKAPHLVAVLLVEHRAGDVGDAAARLDQRHGAVEQRRLLLDPFGERARAHAPLGVGIAPPGAGAGAGRVDQHQIGAAGEIGKHVALAARRADLDVAHAGAREALVDRRQPALVDVGGVDLAAVFHRRRERQRLAAGAGAEIDHLLAGLCAGKERGKLRALVLDFDQALEKGRLGVDRRAFGIGGRAGCASPAATSASARRRDAASFGSTSSRSAFERVDAQIERRAARQRRALGGALVAEDRARNTDRAIPDSRPHMRAAQR